MKTQSQNSVVLTGRLTDDAQQMANAAGVRFSIAHNMGKDNPALFLDLTFFAKNGRFQNKIPTDLLKKGQAVKVSAFMKPNSYTKDDGTMVRGIQFIVKNVEALVPEQAADEADDNEAQEA